MRIDKNLTKIGEEDTAYKKLNTAKNLHNKRMSWSKKSDRSENSFIFGLHRKHIEAS